MSLAVLCGVMAALMGFAAWRGRQGGGAAPLIVILMALLPPLLVTWTILSAQSRLGDLRVALEAVSLDLSRGGYSIGGDAARDALVVRGMQPAALTIASDEHGGALLTFRGAAGGPAGVVSTDQGQSFLGAVPLPEGGPLQWGSETYTRRGDSLVDAQGTSVPLGELTRNRRQIVTLRERIGDPQTARVDFLFGRKGGWFQPTQVYLMRMSPAAGESAPTLRLAEGETAHLWFYALSLAEPWENRAGEAPSSRVSERRSLRAEVRQGRLLLTFDTPEQEVVPAWRLGEALTAAGQANPSVSVLFALDTGSAAQAESVMGFDTLGEPVRGQLAGRLILDSSPERFVIDNRGRRTAARYGQAFNLGGAAQAQIRVTRLDLGWRSYGGVIGVPWAAALAALAAGLAWRTRSVTATIIMGLAEMLLAIRILVAVEGAFVDTGPDAVAAPSIALAAFIAIPFILTLLFAPRRTIGRWAAAAYAVGAAALMAFNQWNAGIDLAHPSSAFEAAAIMTLAGIGALAWRVTAPARRRRVAAWARRSFFLARRWIDAVARSALLRLRIPDFFPFLDDRRRRLWVWALAGVLLLTLGRIVLAAAHIYERFPFHLGAVSLIWTPASLALCGLLLWLVVTAEPGRPRHELLRIVLFWGGSALLLFIAPGLVAHDRGYAIQALPLMFLAALLAAGSAPSRTPMLRFASLAVPLGLVAIGLITALASAAAPPRPSAWEQIADPSGPEAHRLLRQAANAQASELRLQAWLRPGETPSYGSRAAEEYGAAAHHMQVYGSPPSPLGRGYLNLTPPTELMRYHFDDNLSVVHLVSPFGRLGALMLVVMQWVAAAAVTALVLGAGPRPRPSRIAGLAALWTFPFICAYMLLANLQVALFTGRDVYFLAANSISDIFEATLLTALALATLTLGRRA